MNQPRSVIKIGAGEIQHLVYKDIPVVTFDQIAAVHGVSPNSVRSSFRKNSARFIEGKHFFRLDFSEVSQLVPGAQITASPNGLTLFTEAGYLLLVKPMRDDTAWQVQEKMIEAYFRLKQLTQAGGDLTEGDALVRMAMAYRDQQKQLETHRKELEDQQRAMIQAQQDIIQLQRSELETKEHMFLAIQAMQWVTIRQYVQIYKLTRQMPDPVQQRYSIWLTTYCFDRHLAMYKAPTADKQWPNEKTYCITAIQDTLPGWLKRYGGNDQGSLHGLNL